MQPCMIGIMLTGNCGTAGGSFWSTRGIFRLGGWCRLGVAFIAGDWWCPQNPYGDFVCFWHVWQGVLFTFHRVLYVLIMGLG